MKPLAYLLFLGSLAGIAAAGPITLVFSSPTQSITPGGTLGFNAMATNTQNVTENLNSDSFTVGGNLQLNDSDFFNNWPLSLNAGASFGPAELFTIFVPLSTATGTYSGSIDILGGPGANDQNVLAVGTFSVTVTPEPGTIALMGIGLAGAALLRRRILG